MKLEEAIHPLRNRWTLPSQNRNAPWTASAVKHDQEATERGNGVGVSRLGPKRLNLQLEQEGVCISNNRLES